jgi:hypothetical protein
MIVQEWSQGDYNNDREVAYLDATKGSVAKIAKMMEAMGSRETH